MKDFKDQFPVTGQCTYLNTASCGLLSKSLVEWRHEHDENLLDGGSMFRDLHKAHIREIRRSVGQFFFSSEENVALVPNFSFGMNTILDGLPKGQKVLLLKEDYPSINWPVQNRDFEICYAEIDQHLEQNIEAAVEKYRPDIFAFSVVQYTSGILIDLNFLKQLKTKYPNLLLIADATQFFGTTNFNFEESAIDVMGASSYKWMLAGYGNGFFLIKQEAQQKISPITIGLNSADATFDKTKEIEFVGRLEPGHLDTLNYGSLGESIRFLQEVGKDSIERHLSSINDNAKREFKKLGLLDSAVSNRALHSCIYNIKGDGGLFQKLKENNIIGSLRGKGIRLSFHFYNSEKDLEKLLTLLH
jgi:selenocysteine lyase/cysteine desulfurase